MDLFIAGTEATSTIVTWASFYLATRPDIQSQIFEEIKAIVGIERLPSLQDMHSLVYTEAFIMEVLRISNILIISLSHAPVTDVWIRGYNIQKECKYSQTSTLFCRILQFGVILRTSDRRCSSVEREVA
ncbi:hypothetical protein ACJMK2_008655 [Sinanodonta woodiana]|uniref:Cytochrome P450 n=1 Tax=Sinanodonta woodiana TaxID=1069815 RepID=A0ABD3VN11_SINWO